MNAEDTALGALATNLQRVRELAVLLGNGALQEGDALGIEAELRALKDEALSLANTVSPTGEALFGGATAAEDAFSLQGTAPSATKARTGRGPCLLARGGLSP